MNPNKEIESYPLQLACWVETDKPEFQEACKVQRKGRPRQEGIDDCRRRQPYARLIAACGRPPLPGYPSA